MKGVKVLMSESYVYVLHSTSTSNSNIVIAEVLLVEYSCGYSDKVKAESKFETFHFQLQLSIKQTSKILKF